MKNRNGASGTEEGVFDSPVGPIKFVLDGDELISLKFSKVSSTRAHPQSASLPKAAKRVERALRAYFEGDLKALDVLPIDARGTQFQERVWTGLRRIGPGELTSYSELAAEIGFPGAARAVGTALGRNPVAIIVPCHRVVRNDGSLGGYGGGLDKKRWLLRHEGVAKPQ